MARSQQNPFQVTRLITSALAGGVAMLWVAAWVMTKGGASPLAPDGLEPTLALLVWAALTIPAFGASLYFRNRAAAAPEHAQTATIIAHALLEGPALMGGVLFLLHGIQLLPWLALPVYALGLVLTWPQADWFGER